LEGTPLGVRLATRESGANVRSGAAKGGVVEIVHESARGPPFVVVNGDGWDWSEELERGVRRADHVESLEFVAPDGASADRGAEKGGRGGDTERGHRAKATLVEVEERVPGERVGREVENSLEAKKFLARGGRAEVAELGNVRERGSGSDVVEVDAD
jgi:hypothetical protein